MSCSARPSKCARASIECTITISITQRSLTLTGRADSVCGLSGTSVSAGTAGCRIGPCAESAYAVEPVGVATMMPSARSGRRIRRRRASSNSISRPCEPLPITASLSAMVRSIDLPLRARSRHRAASAPRSRTCRRGSRRCRPACRAWPMSVMKPRRPWLMPTSGTWWRTSSRAAASMVPSPPIDDREVGLGLAFGEDFAAALAQELAQLAAGTIRSRRCAACRSAQSGELRITRGGDMRPSVQ